jgi:hypothetical protein
MQPEALWRNEVRYQSGRTDFVASIYVITVA